eukprot:TRINITY_DN10768_c0_g1_i1.p1 TRINITY_DN10768_c0_g1~~TRINITY_DN10768_c0_g1_i1.p1  ORF type:complete len:521 (-),score=87.68 TRINITY_DN10768_c0_g1_i1:38-1567(-)
MGYKWSFGIFILSLFIIQTLTHKCVHDTVVRKKLEQAGGLIISPQIYQNETAKRGGYNPLRFHVDASQMLGVSGSIKSFVINSLFPTAISYLSNALQVDRVQGNLYYDLQCKSYYTNPYQCVEYHPATCIDATVPNHYTRQYGSGVSNKDFVVFVTANPTSGGALAYAGACSTDQNGRPIFGNVNFDPSHLTVANPGSDEFNFQLGTLLHEMIHALGFSGSSFPSFDNVNVQQFNERGGTVTKLTGSNSRALSEAKSHFGCSSLNGVELESNGGSSSAGSHLAGRIYRTDAMTASADPDNRYSLTISKITLGLLEDSGWYSIDIDDNASDDFIWGKGEGCSFATQKCISNSASNFEEYFCTSSSQLGCSFDRLSKASCAMFQYTNNIPTRFRYFSNSKLGGEQYRDYCPIMAPYSNSACDDSSNLPSTNYYGESYTSQSKCFTGTILDDAYQYSGQLKSGCYKVTDCDSGDRSYKVEVGGNEYPCISNSQVSASGYNGVLLCAPYESVC